MDKFLLVTDIEFWKEDAGNAKRISQLILNITKNNIKLDVAFIGKIYKKEKIEKKYLINIKEIISLRNYFKIQCKKFINYFPILREIIRRNMKIYTIEDIKSSKLKKDFKNSFKNLEEYTGIIVEYIYLDYILPEEYTGKKIIDTHDIQSDRYITYSRKNQFCRFKILPEEEKEILNKYSYILVVSERDKKIVEELGIEANKILFLPIYEKPKKVEASSYKKLRLGFIGAAIDFNIDAINWFIDNVFDRLEKFNVELHVYGKVSGLVKKKQKNIFLHGFIKDADVIYKNIDIVINPVRVGGGIKVKNIEALSKGKLLITSSIGAQGLEDGIGRAFLVANSSEEYLEILNKYFEKELKEIEENSLKYIEKKLNYKKYYNNFFIKILGEK